MEYAPLFLLHPCASQQEKKARIPQGDADSLFWWTRRGSEPLSSASPTSLIFACRQIWRVLRPYKVSSKKIRHTAEAVCRIFGGPEGDRTLEPHGCEPCALPAELRAHIPLGGMSLAERKVYLIAFVSICQEKKADFSNFFRFILFRKQFARQRKFTKADH